VGSGGLAGGSSVLHDTHRCGFKTAVPQTTSASFQHVTIQTAMFVSFYL